MTLDTFFKKFDTFADAPNAVAKMRELVLDWAISGKLCPGNATIWKSGVLGSVIQLISGQHLLAHEHNGVRRGLPYLTGPSDFSERHPVPTRWTESPKVTAEPGDILITVKGSGVGKTNVLKDQQTAIGRQLMAVRAKSADADFVHLVLKGAASHFQNAKTGIAIPGIGRKEILDLPVVLPPLAEQKRIVAKVDELMALCDRLEAEQQERQQQHAALARASLARFADAPTPANLNLLFHKSYEIAPADLRKTILTLAVQGKLVKQDPKDEPADKLFLRIKSEIEAQQAKGLCKPFKPLPTVDEVEKTFPQPNGWRWLRLRSLVFTLGDGLHGTPQYSNGTDCYFINGNNLVDGRIVIKPHTKTVSLAEKEKHRKNMTLNTVLVSINGTLGSVAFYNNENVILGKSACYFNLSSHVDKHFVRILLESPYFVDYATKNATGTTIRNLGLKAMNYFVVPLPPLAEQRRIVAKVDELMALVDALETQLATARASATHLLDALVAELTRQ